MSVYIRDHANVTRSRTQDVPLPEDERTPALPSLRREIAQGMAVLVFMTALLLAGLYAPDLLAFWRSL